jgi:HEAT repeat protein
LQAVRALASVRDVATLDVLVRLLARDDLTDLVRAEALRAAGQVGEKGFLPGLEPLARDWNYALPFTRINEAFLR